MTDTGLREHWPRGLQATTSPQKMANFGFEAGPWDNASKVDGAHVFSKKRKLLYGDEHDKVEHRALVFL